jgi:single-strand selective monofunctional uracil DNA glycosylase
MARTTTRRHQALIDAASQLSRKASKLKFSEPVTHIYNPLQYAWDAHVAYLKKSNPKGVRVLFLGMNPGPWGMAQTGVPFGEIASVRDWIGIDKKVKRPKQEHPKRPIEGFDCPKSEVSGRRFWGLFKDHFHHPMDFFKDHFVVNYCPLVFMEASSKNRTPDKLPKDERTALDECCGQHLKKVISTLEPKFLVGIGAYAERQFQLVAGDIKSDAKLCRILHPSPASPAANRDWVGTVNRQLKEAKIW